MDWSDAGVFTMLRPAELPVTREVRILTWDCAPGGTDPIRLGAASDGVGGWQRVEDGPELGLVHTKIWKRVKEMAIHHTILVRLDERRTVTEILAIPNPSIADLASVTNPPVPDRVAPVSEQVASDPSLVTSASEQA